MKNIKKCPDQALLYVLTTAPEERFNAAKEVFAKFNKKSLEIYQNDNFGSIGPWNNPFITKSCKLDVSIKDKKSFVIGLIGIMNNYPKRNPIFMEVSSNFCNQMHHVFSTNSVPAKEIERFSFEVNNFSTLRYDWGAVCDPKQLVLSEVVIGIVLIVNRAEPFKVESVCFVKKNFTNQEDSEYFLPGGHRQNIGVLREDFWDDLKRELQEELFPSVERQDKHFLPLLASPELIAPLSKRNLESKKVLYGKVKPIPWKCPNNLRGYYQPVILIINQNEKLTFCPKDFCEIKNVQVVSRQDCFDNTSNFKFKEGNMELVQKVVLEYESKSMI